MHPNGQLTEAMIDRFAAYRDRPADFQRDILGRTLHRRQIDVCDAVAQSRTVCVPAGRAVGKSYLMAGLVLWFLYSRRGSRVVTTAPDHRQICAVLWSELKKAIYHARCPLPYEYLTGGYGSPQRLSIDSMNRWEALGFSAAYQEGFSGTHAGDLMCIVDESSGITPQIWSAIDGLAASKMVLSGNPLRFDSRFRELHDLAMAGSSTIATVPIPSTDSPHATWESSPVGLADRAFIGFMREIHGENSPWWRCNIAAEFPGEHSVRFLPDSWLNTCGDPACLQDELWQAMAPGPRIMSVDLAAGVGSCKSVVLIRDNRQIIHIFASADYGIDDQAANRLEPVVASLAEHFEVHPSRASFDQAGLGSNFASYMSAYGYHGMTGYFGGGKGGTFYANRRSANAYAFKRRIDPYRGDCVPFWCGAMPEWPMLRQELEAMYYGEMSIDDDGNVRQALELKSSLAARIHRSPDLLDALLQSFNWSTTF